MYRNRLQERKGGQIVARPAQRDLRWEQEAKGAVLELLANGPARVEDIARRLHRDPSITHEIIRRLQDEDRVHTDSGYWVFGPRRQRFW